MTTLEQDILGEITCIVTYELLGADIKDGKVSVDLELGKARAEDMAAMVADYVYKRYEKKFELIIGIISGVMDNKGIIGLYNDIRVDELIRKISHEPLDKEK